MSKKYTTPVRKPYNELLNDSLDSPPPPTLTPKKLSNGNQGDSVESDGELVYEDVEDENPENKEETKVESKPEEIINSVPTPENPALLKEDPFSTETSRELFEGIDELRKCGAGRDLDLPQLVIVGKQSAGKSSLLESLTDIPFPVGDELCTRFATRIVSRRTEPEFSDSIRISIEPGDINPFNREENEAGAEAFVHTLESLTRESFADVIEKAKKIMGVDDRRKPNKHFSSLVLKIELSGPQRSQFGILDIPGYFTNPFKTSQTDMEGVQKLIISYMSKPENIVICVADANDDLANQDIFTLASQHVDGARIVGVWTKCDVASSPGKIVSHVRGGNGVPGIKTHWFAVQNRPKNPPPSFDRETEERKTFSNASWAGLPEQQRGTVNLKRYLADFLCRRIRESFPTMQEKVRKMLDDEVNRLEGFGKPRVEHSDRINYLMGIVNRYQDLANKSLKSPGELPKDSVKLRGMTRKLNMEFNDKMLKYGVRYKFLAIDDPIEMELTEETSADTSDDSTQFNHSNGISVNRQSRSRPPLPPVTSPSRNVQKSLKVKREVHPLYAKIRHQIEMNRGEELPGMLNPSVLRPLYRDQTAPWQKLAEKHLDQIITTTTDVSLELFNIAAENEGMTKSARQSFEAIIAKFEADKRKEATRELHLQCYRNANMALQTTDPKFLEAVHKARDMRFSQALTRYHLENPLLSDATTQIHNALSASAMASGAVVPEFIVITSDKITTLFNQLHPQGRSQNIEDEIHDILRAYYEIAIQNFITYVNSNIVEEFLNSPTGPLLGLTTRFIIELSPDEVQALGGEDETNAAARKDCEDKILRLQKANRIATETWKKTREMIV